METQNLTQLTKETVLSLGYTQTDLDNAVYSEDYLVLPDARLFEDFETLKTYKILNNIVYIDSIFIIHDNIKIKYYNNSNWKLGYRFSANKPRKEILNYDENKFIYEGNKIIKYNKKNIALNIEAVAKDYVYYMDCFNKSTNNIKENQEIFKSKGFDFRSEKQAHLYTKHFLIEIELLDNGDFIQKITNSYSGTKEDKLSLIDKLINLK